VLDELHHWEVEQFLQEEDLWEFIVAIVIAFAFVVVQQPCFVVKHPVAFTFTVVVAEEGLTVQVPFLVEQL